MFRSIHTSSALEHQIVDLGVPRSSRGSGTTNSPKSHEKLTPPEVGHSAERLGGTPAERIVGPQAEGVREPVWSQSGGSQFKLAHSATSPRNAVALWLAGFRSPNTRRAYERELQAFAEFTRHDSIEDAVGCFLGLTETDAHKVVDAWRAEKLHVRGNSPATINRSMAALNSFVTSARRGGFTTLRLEAQGVPTKAYRDTRGPGLPVYLRMLDIARQQRDRRRAARDVAILQLAFGLALRRNEISALNIGDLDVETGRLMIMGKGRAEQEPLTLSEELKEALADWLRYRRCTDPAMPLFVGAGRASRDNGRFTGDGIYKIVKRFGAMAGSANVRPHGLRHTAITESLSRTGGDFRKVRAFSRHSSINIVAVYDDNRNDNGGEVSAILTALTRETRP